MTTFVADNNSLVTQYLVLAEAAAACFDKKIDEYLSENNNDFLRGALIDLNGRIQAVKDNALKIHAITHLVPPELIGRVTLMENKYRTLSALSKESEFDVAIRISEEQPYQIEVITKIKKRLVAEKENIRPDPFDKFMERLKALEDKNRRSVVNLQLFIYTHFQQGSVPESEFEECLNELNAKKSDITESQYKEALEMMVERYSLQCSDLFQKRDPKRDPMPELTLPSQKEIREQLKGVPITGNFSKKNEYYAVIFTLTENRKKVVEKSLSPYKDQIISVIDKRINKIKNGFAALAIPTMARVGNAGAGQCFFFSLAQALTGKSSDAPALREAIVNQMRSDPNRYTGGLDVMMRLDPIYQRQFEGFCRAARRETNYEGYLAWMSQSVSWAGDMELRAAADFLAGQKEETQKCALILVKSNRDGSSDATFYHPELLMAPHGEPVMIHHNGSNHFEYIESRSSK